ncbi:MAG: hypothetical protein ACREP2_01070 [Rhodanobacteraceae bacterium]
MNMLRPLMLATLFGSLTALGACSSGQSESGGIASAVDHSISSAMDKAQAKLRTEPIEVSHNDPTLPKAEITPNGDFIVGGKTIAITPAQRTALLEYRAQLIAIATQGIAIGKQGAALGIHAASAAIAGVFSGKSDKEIEANVKAQTGGIREGAAKICDRLPAMMTEQQKLAAILPAFKPYATMTQQDIRGCRHDALKDDDG